MGKQITLPKDELRDLKEQVRARDKHRCRKCKSSSAYACHHIQFRSDRGDDKSSNLVLLCNRCHDACHGKISDYFLVIVNPESDLIPPNANVGLRFKTYNKVQRRVRWKL